MGYSETAFVEAQGSRGQYRVRYFSPQAEVAFCGHATIAAAVAIADRDGPRLLQFSTLAGPIPVQTRVTSDGVTATLTSVPTRTRAAQAQELDAALAALGWQRSDLDPHYPAHVAYAGNDHLVLAVRERSLLAALDYDFPMLGALMAQRAWTTVHLVWAESRTLFHARDPFPPGGVIEDPATGAAAAAFGGYPRTLGCGRVAHANHDPAGRGHGPPQPTPRRPQHRRRRRSVDRHRSPNPHRSDAVAAAALEGAASHRAAWKASVSSGRPPAS